MCKKARQHRRRWKVIWVQIQVWTSCGFALNHIDKYIKLEETNNANYLHVCIGEEGYISELKHKNIMAQTKNRSSLFSFFDDIYLHIIRLWRHKSIPVSMLMIRSGLQRHQSLHYSAWCICLGGAANDPSILTRISSGQAQCWSRKSLLWLRLCWSWNRTYS